MHSPCSSNSIASSTEGVTKAKRGRLNFSHTHLGVCRPEKGAIKGTRACGNHWHCMGESIPEVRAL